MRVRVCRVDLRNEEGCHEERVIVQLDDSDFSLSAEAADNEAAVFESRLEIGVDAVVTEKWLDDLRCPVQLRGVRARENRHCLFLPDQRAGERRDDQMIAGGIRFCVFGVSEPEDIARELYDRVLEPTSGPDQGHVSLSRVADRRKGSLHAVIRAGGRAPDSVVRGQPVLRSLWQNVRRRDPFEVQTEVADRLASKDMNSVAWVKVPDDPDQAAHAAIIPGARRRTLAVLGLRCPTRSTRGCHLRAAKECPVAGE